MFLCPIKAPVTITQHFGERPSVYKQFGLRGHNGHDIRASVGMVIHAPFDGTITIGNDGKGGYGKYVRVRNAEYECVLAHLSRVDVTDGQKVRLGDPLGLTGNTGFSTAPHLHFGLRKVNPDGTIKDTSNGFAGYVDIEKYIINWTGLLIQ